MIGLLADDDDDALVWYIFKNFILNISLYVCVYKFQERIYSALKNYHDGIYELA